MKTKALVICLLTLIFLSCDSVDNMPAEFRQMKVESDEAMAEIVDRVFKFVKGERKGSRDGRGETETQIPREEEDQRERGEKCSTPAGCAGPGMA